MSRISLFQFHGEKRAPDGAPLHWPGNGQFPFRGNAVPDLKGDQAADLPLRLTFQSGEFCLWKPEEKKAFDNINNHFVSGVWLKLHRENVTKPEGLWVWLEWAIVAAELPERGALNGQNAFFAMPTADG